MGLPDCSAISHHSLVELPDEILHQIMSYVCPQNEVISVRAIYELRITDRQMFMDFQCLMACIPSLCTKDFARRDSSFRQDASYRRIDETMVRTLDPLPALMRTHPTIAAIIRPIFFHENTFEFKEWSEVERFGKAIGKPDASLVQRLVVDSPHQSRYGGIDDKYPYRWNHFAPGAMERFRNVRSLKIKFCSIAPDHAMIERIDKGSFDRWTLRQLQHLHNSFPLLKHDIVMLDWRNSPRASKSWGDEVDLEISASLRPLEQYVRFKNSQHDLRSPHLPAEN